MTQASVAFTDLEDATEAGAHLGQALNERLNDEPPDAVIVFASARYDYEALLQALDASCRPGVMVGCSSAGEFINKRQGAHSACAVGLRSDDITFAAGLGTNLGTGLAEAAEAIASAFHGVNAQPARFHSALVMTDALAGQADDLIERLNVRTGGQYRFFGGGAGDDARFSRTHVFCGTQARTNAAVALEMLSRKPIGIGVRHGWKPARGPLRATETDAMRLVSLNGSPVAEIFREHAEETGQDFDAEAPLSFFLHNVLGIDTGGGFKLRVPLTLNDDGSVTCAAEIPEGSTVYIMQATETSAADAAATATTVAMEQLQDHRPEIALFFDCVATRLRMGSEFGLELDALEGVLGSAKYAGCNTYGQIARVPGQFSGFHNCTAVVCIIPA